MKADEGRIITDKMIEGYDNLNVNVENTMNLIDNVSNTSKEQLLGMEQINEAVTQLDTQTQKNLEIAKETQNIVNMTSDISREILNNVKEKEFIGK